MHPNASSQDFEAGVSARLGEASFFNVNEWPIDLPGYRSYSEWCEFSTVGLITA